MVFSEGRVLLDHVRIEDCDVGNHSVISVEPSAGLVLHNATLQNIQGSRAEIASVSAKSNSYLAIEDSVFRKINGMAVLEFLQNATGTIRNSLFASNSVAGKGSAIRAESSSHLELKSVAFQENSASLGGGAVFAYNTSIGIRNCRFVENTGMNGGALLFKVLA